MVEKALPAEFDQNDSENLDFLKKNLDFFLKQNSKILTLQKNPEC